MIRTRTCTLSSKISGIVLAEMKDASGVRGFSGTIWATRKKSTSLLEDRVTRQETMGKETIEKMDSLKSSVSKKIDQRTAAFAKVITKASETWGRGLLSHYDSTLRAAFGLMVAGFGFLYHIEDSTRGKVEGLEKKMDKRFDEMKSIVLASQNIVLASQNKSWLPGWLPWPFSNKVDAGAVIINQDISEKLDKVIEHQNKSMIEHQNKRWWKLTK